MRRDGAGPVREDHGRDDRSARVAEAVAIARYLLGRDPAPELVDRYLELSSERLPGREHEREARWMREHPWSIPLLDAGAGWRDPAALVRLRVRLMAAILEASPRHASFFLDPPASRPAVGLEVLLQGLRAAVLLAAGIPLYAWITRRRGGA